MSVDNSTCGTPCQIQRPLGTAVSINAPAQSVTGYGTRQDFLRWSDGASASRTVKAGMNTTALVASFRSMRQMIAVSDPDQGAKITFDPPSPDGFYDVNSQVTVTLTPQPGYRFDRWEGDLSGSSPRDG
jgi:hypothetical protein